jgi:Sec1 family
MGLFSSFIRVTTINSRNSKVMYLLFGVQKGMQRKWLPRKSNKKFETPSFHRLVRMDRRHYLPKIQQVYPTFSDRVSYKLIFASHALDHDLLVLLILDRNVDLVPMICHGWTYQALVSDCLDMKLNRVVVQNPQKKSYDLDSKDFFWAKNASDPFPQVAEEIDTELNRYKQDAAEITRSTGVSDVNDISQM